MAPTQLEERRLVRRLLAGEDRAFEEMFDAYFPRLYGFALTRLRNDASAAEEVVQAALGRAMMRIDTFRGEAPLFSWLCTFCRREVSAHVERLRRREPELPEAEASFETDSGLDGRPGPAWADPERAASHNELSRVVYETLDSLPGRYGDVLEWKYIEGVSIKEIAGRLDSTQKAVESMLSRARRAFHEAFPEGLLPGGRSVGATVSPGGHDDD